MNERIVFKDKYKDIILNKKPKEIINKYPDIVKEIKAIWNTLEHEEETKNGIQLYKTQLYKRINNLQFEYKQNKQQKPKPKQPKVHTISKEQKVKIQENLEKKMAHKQERVATSILENQDIIKMIEEQPIKEKTIEEQKQDFINKQALQYDTNIKFDILKEFVKIKNIDTKQDEILKEMQDFYNAEKEKIVNSPNLSIQDKAIQSTYIKNMLDCAIKVRNERIKASSDKFKLLKEGMETMQVAIESQLTRTLQIDNRQSNVNISNDELERISDHIKKVITCN